MARKIRFSVTFTGVFEETPESYPEGATDDEIKGIELAAMDDDPHAYMDMAEDWHLDVMVLHPVEEVG